MATTTGNVRTRQDSLPAEIWTMIVERVERTNDLLACRQVNRLLHSITTPICRRRYLRLNLYTVRQNIRNNANLTSFYSTFKDCDLPWSACKLDVDTSAVGMSCLSLLQIREFIRLFGSQIHELTIVGGNIYDDNEGLLATISGVPNIKYLDLSLISISQPIQESFSAQLGKLKGLIASIYIHADFRFFQLLLNRPEVHLRSLQLTIRPNDWPLEIWDVLSTLLTGIPILHLELGRFDPELFTTLTRERVQIHQLIIHLDSHPLSAIPGFYSSFEEFLKNTADSLQKLILNDNQWSRGNVRLAIPMLPQLTYLGVNNAGRTWGGGSHSTALLSNVTPLTSDQFPRLAQVNARGYSRFRQMTLWDMGLGPFDTVTELVLEDGDTPLLNPLETDWDKIFPNLKQLSADVTGIGLPSILNKFRRLERLFLTVFCEPYKYRHSGEELSKILSGRRLFGNETQGQDEESEAASLLSLTRLKEFKFLAIPLHTTMCDAFVDSYLLRIQPLENLYLENVVISDEYKEKLQRYHRKTEIYNHRNPIHYNAPPSKFHDGLR